MPSAAPLAALIVTFACQIGFAADVPGLPKGAIARFGTPLKVDPKQGDDHTIEAVCFTADGAAVVSGKRGGMLVIHDIAGGKEIASVKAHEGGITAILRRANKRLITSGHDGTIKEWDAAGKALRTITTIKDQNVPVTIAAMALSNNGKKLAITTNGDIAPLQVLDAVSGRPVQKLKGPPRSYGLAFAPDDLTLLLAGAEVLQMWNLATNSKQWQRGQELPKGIAGIADSPFYSGVAFSPDKKYGAATMDSQMGAYILLWDAKTGKGHKRIAVESGHVHFAFSPDGKWIALGGSKPQVTIFNVETGEIAHDFPDPGARVLSIAYSADGQRLATGAEDGVTTVWDMAVLTEK